MIRTAFAAPFLLGTLLLASPVAALSQQEALEARYDRALAAGYKALMLCGAIANAEANGVARSPESVMQWELSGIQAPLDAIISDLPHDILRRPTGQIAHVAVRWADDMPARIAAYYGPQTGCSILPIGAPEDSLDPSQPIPVETRADEGTAVQVKAAGRSQRRARPQSEDGLDAVLIGAIGQGYGTGRTTAVVVNRYDAKGVLEEGRERYAAGFDEKTPQRTWSVAKSIAATLVGGAVLSGDFSADDPIGLNDWSGGGAADLRSAITIDHALRMATGRFTDTPGNRTDPLYYGGSTIKETVTPWPVLHRPGTVFRYANNDTLLALIAIKPWLDFYPPHELFAKLGMNHTVAETDWKGNYVLSSQVWATAPDLVRLGELYLRNGKLPSGERILPEGWARYVSTPSGPQPEGEFGYGAGFWLLNRSEGVPSDTFMAIGNRGQYVVIVPSRQVVIVRRGEDPAGSGFDIAAFTRDVLAALASS
ncbi:MAG: serine hydrolase domain-containing protein [Erythrobacter sp.]